jgi:hypothetical protein
VLRMTPNSTPIIPRGQAARSVRRISSTYSSAGASDAAIQKPSSGPTFSCFARARPKPVSLRSPFTQSDKSSPVSCESVCGLVTGYVRLKCEQGRASWCNVD